MDLNADSVLDALKALGDELAVEVPSAGQGLEGNAQPWRLVIAGGSAGLLSGSFHGSRSTTDCDVPWLDRDAGSMERWARIERAALRVSDRLGLSPEWLNRKCAMFVWSWPLGWEGRCERVAGDFGAIELWRLGRSDLIAAKVMSASKRHQDRLDLRDLAPTRDEIDAVEAHLDRLRAEDLDRGEFEGPQTVLDTLREWL